MAACILVAENNPSTRQIIRFNLAQFGEVVDVTDGADAWEILQHVQVDLLVTDERMPRMTGLELCQKIRSNPQFADLPIILITATTAAHSDDVRRQLGISKWFSKPFSPIELVTAVRELCRPSCGAA